MLLINHLVPEMPESVARCIGRILNDTREINGGSLRGEVNMARVESRESSGDTFGRSVEAIN